jgi:hypothetical protein
MSASRSASRPLALRGLLLALAITLVIPLGAQAQERQGVEAAAGNFVCELPRAAQYTVCQVGVRKGANQVLQVTNIASADRQVTLRARNAAGNVAGTVNFSPGERRIVVNQGPASTYQLEARTRFPFVSATRFSGSSQVF